MPQGSMKRTTLVKPKGKASGSKMIRKSGKIMKKGRRQISTKKVDDIAVLNKKYTGAVVRGIEERMANKVAQNHQKLGVLNNLISPEVAAQVEKDGKKKGKK